MKKRLKSFAAILFALITTFSFAAAASGSCEVFYFQAGANDLGPGGTASITSSLRGLGYTVNRYADTHAYYVRRTMNADKVFAIVAHGLPGRVYCADDTFVSAQMVLNDDLCYSLAANFSNNAFNSMKFAYYGSCCSATTDSTYGNLLSYTTSTLGAKSALGFNDSVYNNCATYFETDLFKSLANGNTVYGAAAIAKTNTYNAYGTYGKVDSCRITGSSSTTIT